MELSLETALEAAGASARQFEAEILRTMKENFEAELAALEREGEALWQFYRLVIIVAVGAGLGFVAGSMGIDPKSPLQMVMYPLVALLGALANSLARDRSRARLRAFLAEKYVEQAETIAHALTNVVRDRVARAATRSPRITVVGVDSLTAARAARTLRAVSEALARSAHAGATSPR